MKRIAAITTVRNDEFFLRKWVKYYGGQLGDENIYVLLDGLDQQVPAWCPSGVNIRAIEKIPGQVVEMDRRRAAIMSAEAAGLLENYDMVIGTDGDEFIVVDPALGMSLPEYLSSLPSYESYSALGLDVGQNVNHEGIIDETRTFLSQRKYALIDTRYTKASIISKPVEWGSGFHRIRHGNFHIQKDLYLFHFGYVDLERIKARIGDKDRVDGGWSRHLAKRARTIAVISKSKISSWEKWTVLARRLQTVLRPPYAWNKPGMLKMNIVVRIPDRFEDIV